MSTNQHPRTRGTPPLALTYAADHINRAAQDLGTWLHRNPDPRLLQGTVDSLTQAIRIIGDHAPVTVTIVPATPAGSPVRAEAEGAQ